ncbi:hypothetical protein HAX54_002774 [Datura stramonium]|uniref:Uncharacterized protein n=1 Tax=Datura stramonium TaxID=4076 RepID=A0ABS8T4D5_DATST|nr:hypothetical protein [Datura stramonium]
MILLASQMESKASMITHELTKEETTLTPSNVDEEDKEWEVEESFFKETCEGIILNIDGRSEELEEVWCRLKPLSLEVEG